uniref:WW domain-containing protein n=1 Tax=Eptatretus burgeri TaxID=7764 RepID=A0A8C4NFV4_EPTBU
MTSEVAGPVQSMLPPYGSEQVPQCPQLPPDPSLIPPNEPVQLPVDGSLMPMPGPQPSWDTSYAQTFVVPQVQPAMMYQPPGPPPVIPSPAQYGQAQAMQPYVQPPAQYMQSQHYFGGQQPGLVPVAATVAQAPPPVVPFIQPGSSIDTVQQPVQQAVLSQSDPLELPPPSPPKPKAITLPVNWRTATDTEGKIYYYHAITRQTQWDPPSWDSEADDNTAEHEAEMDLGTPTYDETPTKQASKKPKTAEADTSTELAKRSKDTFRKELSQFIVQCLNPYRKPDCKAGRIVSTEDFKHLARKLTHGVMNKELKNCRNHEDLEVNENVKHKTREYIKKYMQKFGPVYRPKDEVENEQM